jgi:hypothetical protein
MENRTQEMGRNREKEKQRKKMVLDRNTWLSKPAV